MKTAQFYTLLIFSAFLSLSVTGQVHSNDEAARKRLLLPYLEQAYFEYTTAEAEAVANTLKNSYLQSLHLPSIDYSNLAKNDQLKLESLFFGLKSLLTNPTPSWEEIIELEKARLLREDSALRRKSKYSTNTSEE